MTDLPPIKFRTPEQVVFTGLQAVDYLQLPSLRALGHLVDSKKLIRPAMYQKSRVYWKSELDRFLRDCTESYGDIGGEL